MTRGIRNNNPLNIVKTKDEWLGQCSGSDARFCVFTHMKFGIRAAVILFRNYSKNYGIATLAELVHRFAPTADGNNEQNYVSFLCQRLNLDKDASIPWWNESFVVEMFFAMAAMESQLPYSEEYVNYVKQYYRIYFR